jgi:hypothetical protein
MLQKTISAMLATFALADINEDFRSLLSGQEPMSNLNIEPVWSQFKDEFAL